MAAKEVDYFAAIESIVSAYSMREKSSGWAEFAEKNKWHSDLLNEAMLASLEFEDD